MDLVTYDVTATNSIMKRNAVLIQRG